MNQNKDINDENYRLAMGRLLVMYTQVLVEPVIVV